MLLQKEFVESPLTHKRKKNRGELMQYWVENTHEPIIDKITFDYVQEEMARRRALGPFANKSLNTSCFTGKIKCEKCGLSFVRNTRTNRAKMSQLGGKKQHHWRCAEHNGCATVGLRDDLLRSMTANVLGIAEFDEIVFKEQIDHIDVLSASEIMFCFKDGKTVSRTWEKPKRIGKPWTEERRAKFKESIRKSYTLERRKQMSEHMKQIRKECGKAWRKEE